MVCFLFQLKIVKDNFLLRIAGQMHRLFTRFGLQCTYDSVQGLYSITDPHGAANGTVQLIVFEKVYQEQVGRICFDIFEEGNVSLPCDVGCSAF